MSIDRSLSQASNQLYNPTKDERWIATYINKYTEENAHNSKGTHSLDYNRVHSRRFLNSYNWIANYLQPNLKILELGGSGLFSYIIQDLNPSFQIDSTNTDLRYKLDLNSQSYDFILNMEVIEHIKDQNSNSIGEIGCFTKSGVNTFLSECYRLLKPNGLMFLTTPNLTSLDNIHRILHHLPPINYYPHFREYSIGELKEFAENHKFAVLKIDTFDSWNEYQPKSRSEILSLLSQNGYSTENRKENIFMLWQKS